MGKYEECLETTFLSTLVVAKQIKANAMISVRKGKRGVKTEHTSSLESVPKTQKYSQELNPPSDSTKPKTTVAVKIVDISHVKKEYLEKFLPRETTIWSRIRHPNIVTMNTHFIEGKKWFIVLEFVPCGDLLRFIQKKGAQGEEQCAEWFKELLSALHFLHSHAIAHRDLKLENILIGEQGQLKISDFGFCREMHSKEELSSTFCGSKAYSAPEVLLGLPYDPFKADVWSLGVILFIVASGVMPFNEHVPRQSIMVEAQKNRAYSFPQGVSTGPLCLETIDYLLTFDSQKRPSTREVLEMEWVKWGWKSGGDAGVRTRRQKMGGRGGGRAGLLDGRGEEEG